MRISGEIDIESKRRRTQEDYGRADNEGSCFFYTAQPIRKRVDYQSFINFINNYPRPLERDCCGISDPPSITYNDFELANRWPYSVVANTWAYEDDPSSYYYEDMEKRSYYIVENYEELYNSKIGNRA